MPRCSYKIVRIKKKRVLRGRKYDSTIQVTQSYSIEFYCRVCGPKLRTVHRSISIEVFKHYKFGFINQDKITITTTKEKLRETGKNG